MVSPIFFIFLLLSVRLISCDALCHVVLEVLVEERIVVFMEAGRSEIIGHIGYGSRDEVDKFYLLAVYGSKTEPL